MSRTRITSLLILAEDELTYRFLRRYCHLALGVGPSRIRSVFSRAVSGKGAGEKAVRDQYPAEVRALRSYNGKNASAAVRLVVHVDADNYTVFHRHDQLAQALRGVREPVRAANEMIAIVVPKRHTETWIHGLAGEASDEAFEESDWEKRDYRNKLPYKNLVEERMRPAAKRLCQLTVTDAPYPMNSPRFRMRFRSFDDSAAESLPRQL